MAEAVQVAFRVYATDWGLRGHGSRQIDWLVDGKLLHKDNVLFVIDQRISWAYKNTLASMYRIYDGSTWMDSDENRWTRFLRTWRPRHWVSYNDYHPRHKIRNRILRTVGCQTWHYSHSVNVPKEGYPPWRELEYDHLVLWNEMDAKHFEGGQKHILGPLFSSQVPQTVVAVFDSTWEHYPNGTREKFFVGLFDLLDHHPSMAMLYKPKYKTIPIERPRFYTLPEWIEPGLVIGCANLTIGLTGTSPVIEARGAGKHAVWYDPLTQTVDDLDLCVVDADGGPAQRFRELLLT